MLCQWIFHCCFRSLVILSRTGVLQVKMLRCMHTICCQQPSACCLFSSICESCCLFRAQPVIRSTPKAALSSAELDNRQQLQGSSPGTRAYQLAPDHARSHQTAPNRAKLPQIAPNLVKSPQITQSMPNHGPVGYNMVPKGQ